jgi:hypothetical protein
MSKWAMPDCPHQNSRGLLEQHKMVGSDGSKGLEIVPWSKYSVPR